MTLILKTIKLFELVSKAFKADKNKVIRDSGDKINETAQNLSKTKKIKNAKSKISTHFSNMRAIKKLTFLIFSTKEVFNRLMQAFIKVLIF